MDNEQAQRMAQVCLDLHGALGVKWGDDPYAAIARLRKQLASALKFVAETGHRLTHEMYDDVRNRAGLAEDCKAVAGQQMCLNYLDVQKVLERAVTAEDQLAHEIAMHSLTSEKLAAESKANDMIAQERDAFEQRVHGLEADATELREQWEVSNRLHAEHENELRLQLDAFEQRVRELEPQPCCMEWHTCLRACLPLAENWRMAAKKAEAALAEAQQPSAASPVTITSVEGNTIGVKVRTAELPHRKPSTIIDSTLDEQQSNMEPSIKTAEVGKYSTTDGRATQGNMRLPAHCHSSAEPVATLHDDGHWTWNGVPPHESNFAGWRMKVYTTPPSLAAAVALAVEKCAKIADTQPDTLESVGKPGSGCFRPRSKVAEQIRALSTVLTAEAEAMQRDAERYRWLRDRNWHDDAICVVTNPKETVRLGTNCPSRALLDAAIDAARGKP